MSDTVQVAAAPSSEPLPMPPASGQIIEIVPRGVTPSEPGIGSGEGGGIGAGEGEGYAGIPTVAEPDPAAPEGAPGPATDAPGPSYEESLSTRQAEATVDRARQARASRERQRQSRQPPAAIEPIDPEAMRREAQSYAEARAAALPQAQADGPMEAPGGDAGAASASAAPPARQERARPAVLEATRTVARNASEALTGIPRGVVGAFASAFEAADDLADVLNRLVPLSDVQAGDPNTPGRWMGRQIRRLQFGREPETVAGKVSEEITQVVIGFMRGQAVLRGLGALQGVGRGAQMGRAALSGAIADGFFNEASEQNLADVWARMGLPGSAFADFLTTSPDDMAALNRLRNAAAGVVVGAALDAAIAFARVARATRAARQEAGPAAKPKPQPEPSTLAEAAGVPARPERDLMIVGDASRPLVEMRGPVLGDPAARMIEAAAATSDAAIGVSSATAARGLVGAAADARGMGPAAHLAPVENTAAIRAATDVGPVFINWGRINSPEDVQAVMRDMADANRGSINEAGRGVQTNAETVRLAGMLNLTPEQLLARRSGETFNAEMITAARQLYTASGQALLQAAEAAAARGAGPLDQVAFRRMMATHYAIQAQVLGVRREAARALQAWAIPANGGAQQMRLIEDLLESSGGTDVSRAMAERLANVARNKPADELPGAMSSFVNRGWKGRTIESIQQWWINSLLSSPATHVANVVGNGLNLPLYMMERAAQAGVARLTGSADAALDTEAPVMLYGLLTGFRDSLRLAARTYGDDGAEVARLIGRQDVPRQGAISSRGWGVDPSSGVGRTLDFVGHHIVSAPGRAMGAEDAFFKSTIYRMELHAQALRQATRETPRRADGSLDSAAIRQRMAEIIRDPPASVTTAAADEALYRTFNREAGPIVRKLMELRASDSPGWNLFMSVILPFVRTPGNLFSYGLERTPMAPLVGQWRADIAAGGARRDSALARMATGSMILAHTYQLAEQGFVTGYGPIETNERAAWLRAGNQPYSVRIGDAWVPFNRLDPYGFMLGFASDLRELMDKRDLSEREEIETTKLIAAMTAFFANAVGERTVFRGVAGLAEAIDRRQPDAERFVGQTLSSLLVPGIVSTVGQAIDPTMYDRGQGWIASRMAGLASNPGIPRRNVWGEVMVRPGVEMMGATAAALSPVRLTSATAGRPIDKEMVRLNMGRMPIDQNGTVRFGTATVNLRNKDPAALDQLRRWAGNEMPLPAFGNLGLADALDEMVQGQGPRGAEYARANDAGKEKAIRDTITLFHQIARAKLLSDPAFADVRDLVTDRRAAAGDGRGQVRIPTEREAHFPPGEAPRRGRAPDAPTLR